MSAAALGVVRAVVVHVCVHEKCNSEIKCIVMLKGHFHGNLNRCNHKQNDICSINCIFAVTIIKINSR